jgi:hypothetical protein
MIKTIVKVRGSINGIKNKYSINSFYYSTRNHAQKKINMKDQAFIVLSVIQHKSRIII